MKVLNITVLAYFLDDIVQYFAEAVGRIFGPDDDFYPAVGVQPFDGEPYSKLLKD